MREKDCQSDCRYGRLQKLGQRLCYSQTLSVSLMRLCQNIGVSIYLVRRDQRFSLSLSIAN